MPRNNKWSQTAGLGDKPVFLYSGTLGLKHRPDLLYSLAKQLGPRCTVLVISEGVGRNYLDKQPPLSNLLTMNFQPYDRLPEVLASADVLVATLEPEAGQFAVPSKVLTYLSARRPVLLAGPQDHLSASIVQRSKAGLVVDPADNESWIKAAQRLLADSGFRESLASNAEAYASSSFDIGSIANRFEVILHGAIGPEAEDELPRTAAVGA
jgi:glycosyltransferase involved in cell wall biosynthesis